MSTIILSFNVITPLIILLAIGFMIKRKNMISFQAITDMNNLVYFLLLPLNLFKNIYHSDFTIDFDVKLIIFCIVTLITIIIAITIIVMILVKDPTKRAAIIQASFRGNFVIFGLPLATSLYGDQIGGMVSIVIAFTVPITNILAVICLETFSKNKLSFKNIIKSVLLNPMIIASLFAILLVVSKIKIPVFADSSITLISQATTTLSLIILGTSFHFHQKIENMRLIALGVMNKLVIFPVLIIITAITLGFRNEQLVVIMSLFSAPAAISCFPMAAKLGADQELTSGILVYTYVFCVLTIFAFIYVLKTLILI